MPEGPARGPTKGNDMTIRTWMGAAVLACAPAAAWALQIPVALTPGTALGNGTLPFVADLKGLGVTEIGSITVVDAGTPVGGAAGIFSGFDMDGLFLDVDGSLATAGDRIQASAFLFAGSTRPSASALVQPTPAHPGPTFGSLDGTTIDAAPATLDVIGDGVNVANVNSADGFLTLGDGGALVANFAPLVPVGSSLFLILGEQGGQVGEGLSASIFVSDRPSDVPNGEIPLPAAAWMMLAGLGALGAAGRRRRR